VPVATNEQEAEAIYQGLDNNGRLAVQDLVAGGLDPIKAANTIAMRLDPARDKNSAWDSARTAAARFATFGADDMAAGVGAAGGAGLQTLRDGRMMDEGVGDLLGRVWDSAVGAYREGKQERRAEVENAYLDNPNAYRAGAVVGTVGTMGLGTGLQAAKGATLGAKVARGAAVGAPMGAISSLGLGDSDTVGGSLKDAAVGGAIGGSLGALAPLAPLAASKGKELVRTALEKGGQNADELRVLTAVGSTGGSIAKPKVLEEAARVPGGVEEMARVLRETGISKGVTTTGGIAKRAAQVMDDSGALIGKFIDDATAKGGKVDGMALAARLRQEAASGMSGMAGVSDVARQRASTLAKFADRIEEAARQAGEGGLVTPQAAKQLSVAIGDDAAEAYRAAATGRPVSGRGEALMTTRRAAEDSLDPVFRELGIDPAGYAAAKRANQVSRIASEAAETSMGRASKNNLLGLTTATLAQASPTAAIIRQVLGPLAASGRASAAEISRELAKRIPSADPVTLAKLGDIARVAAGGGDEFASALEAVSGDPAVQRALEDLARSEQRRAALDGMQ
jgi:hypothetical protein